MRSRKRQEAHVSPAEYWKAVDEVLPNRAANARASITFAKGTSADEIRETLRARQKQYHKEHA